MSKLIKPLEVGNRALLFKGLTIAVLMIGGVVFNQFYPDLGKGKEQALGEKIAVEKPALTPTPERNVLSATQKTTERFITDTAKKTEDALSEILGEATSSATRFILDTTIGNIVKQVERLPKEQQEKIKEQVCK